MVAAFPAQEAGVSAVADTGLLMGALAHHTVGRFQVRATAFEASQEARGLRTSGGGMAQLVTPAALADDRRVTHDQYRGAGAEHGDRSLSKGSGGGPRRVDEGDAHSQLLSICKVSHFALPVGGIDELQRAHDGVPLDLGKQIGAVIYDARWGLSGNAPDLRVRPFIPGVQDSLQEWGDKMTGIWKDGLKIDRACEGESEVARGGRFRPRGSAAGPRAAQHMEGGGGDNGLYGHTHLHDDLVRLGAEESLLSRVVDTAIP